MRTPEEFDAARIADAQLIDIQGPAFTEGIEALDPAQIHVVYSRSGNRSAVAAEQMRAIGLEVLDGGGLDGGGLDGGGLDDMVSAGWSTA